jgi:hypothetical protein
MKSKGLRCKLLHYHVGEILLTCTSEHLKAIEKDTSAIRTHNSAVQSRVDRLQHDQDSAKHHRLLKWISPTDYPAQQSDIIQRRQKGTGQWFLDAPEVAKWLDKATGTLFCPGIPGAGKTMIAAIMIDHILNSMHNSPRGVAYVYFNYKAQAEQDAASMLAAILKQLTQSLPSTMEPVERLYDQHAGKGTKPSLDELYSALRSVLAHYPAVYIIIDALDECSDTDGARQQFLARLRGLQAEQDVRLMVTSRYISGIIEGFKEASKIEVRASREDVMRFVAGQINRLPKCIQRDPALQELMQEKIAEAADGM